jgi:hypothetical protein
MPEEWVANADAILCQQLESIRDKMRDLEQQWRQLPAGESMELVFPT